MYQVPNVTMPDTLVAGDYWQWRVPALADFPAATWTLSVALRGPATLVSGTGWTIAAEAAGTWLVQVAKATTAGYTAGRYEWKLYVTSGSERYQVASGWIVLQPNVAALTGDNRTHNQKTLALIEAALEGRLTTQEESYSVAGRQITKIPVVELMKMRGYYLAAVEREVNPSEGMKSVGITFPGTG